MYTVYCIRYTKVIRKVYTVYEFSCLNLESVSEKSNPETMLLCIIFDELGKCIRTKCIRSHAEWVRLGKCIRHVVSEFSVESVYV